MSTETETAPSEMRLLFTLGFQSVTIFHNEVDGDYYSWTASAFRHLEEHEATPSDAAGIVNHVNASGRRSVHPTAYGPTMDSAVLALFELARAYGLVSA